MKKFLIVVGIVVAVAAGYVVGTKAGHGRYQEIAAAANSVWKDPAVKKALTKAKKRARKSLDRATNKLQ
ncbi:hypothetical protein [Humibacter sp. RRB41]|uniref:hypothetical protein n=1 Tax=Humibacter sp. RRB41 TaxID=2919946 RepID=UPI001FA9D25A|nr:hypothetical protein [Humibacter sp. RRB41]